MGTTGAGPARYGARTRGEVAAGWAFVLSHAALIRCLVGRAVRCDARLDYDDLHQDVLEDLARVGHRYDPARATPSTFAYWRVRLCRTAALRRLNHDHTAASEAPPGSADPLARARRVPGSGAAEVERRVLAAEVLALATTAQREAAWCVMLDHGGRAADRATGVSSGARTRRLHRLAAAVAG